MGGQEGNKNDYSLLSVGLIWLLKVGNLTINTRQSQKIFKINSGILEVNQDHNVLVLADEAVESSSLEKTNEVLKNI